MSLSMPSYIAIDYGTKKSGLAYSAESFAFAWKTVPTTSLFQILPEFIKQRRASGIIIGMPYNIDGTLSKHGKRVQEFAKKLESTFTIPIILHDERLTSSEAIIGFNEAGIDGDIDAEAARLILESYLQQK